eukprot:8205975-Alexandrium_andersonii.AAC.1
MPCGAFLPQIGQSGRRCLRAASESAWAATSTSALRTAVGARSSARTIRLRCSSLTEAPGETIP